MCQSPVLGPYDFLGVCLGVSTHALVPHQALSLTHMTRTQKVGWRGHRGFAAAPQAGFATAPMVSAELHPLIPT